MEPILSQRAETQPLADLFGLTGSICNAIIIAIDFGFTNNFKKDHSLNLTSSAGLAIFDTQYLNSTQNHASPDFVHPNDIISTYNIVTGSPDHHTTTVENFMFGDIIQTTQDNLLDCITSLIPPNRQIILVCHDMSAESKVLRVLGFDIPTYTTQFTDTQSIFANIFSRYQPSLERVLCALNCPYAYLHCSGNDANFTLRALLLLAIKSINQGTDSETQRKNSVKSLP